MNDFFRRLIVSGISIAIVVVLLLFAFQPIFQYVVAACVAALAGIAI